MVLLVVSTACGRVVECAGVGSRSPAAVRPDRSAATARARMGAYSVLPGSGRLRPDRRDVRPARHQPRRCGADDGHRRARGCPAHGALCRSDSPLASRGVACGGDAGRPARRRPAPRGRGGCAGGAHHGAAGLSVETARLALPARRDAHPEHPGDRARRGALLPGDARRRDWTGPR